jgi:hypothetical protein
MERTKDNAAKPTVRRGEEVMSLIMTGLARRYVMGRSSTLWGVGDYQGGSISPSWASAWQVHPDDYWMLDSPSERLRAQRGQCRGMDDNNWR